MLGNNIASVNNIENMISYCMENRGLYDTIDALIENAPESFDKNLLIQVSVALEKALIKNYKPVSKLDFQKELEKMYGKLSNLIMSLENVDLDLAFSDDYDEKKLKTYLKTLQMAKDYLKLILEAQEKFYKAQKMQEFMDFVIDTVAMFDPSKKSDFIEIINDKLTEG